MRARTEDFSWSLEHNQMLARYFQYFVLVDLSPRRVVPSLDDIVQQMQTDMAKATAMALTRYAAFHETRHFHDALGTVTGLTAFRLNFESLLSFVEMRRALGARAAHTPSPPLKTHYSTEQCPAEVRSFIRRRVLIDRAMALIVGALQPLFVPDTDDWNCPIVELRSTATHTLNATLGIAPTSALCFPQALGWKCPDTGQVVRGTRYIPIDYGTLTEANAQMLQREIAFAEFGPRMREAIVASGSRTVVVSPLQTGWVNRIPVPYDTIDFLLARVARTNGETPSISPDTIYRVTEYALNGASFTWIDDRGIVVLDRPAALLSDLIASELTPESLNGAPVELDHGHARRKIEQMLVHINALPDWRTIPDDGSIESPLLIFYAFIMQEVARPLLTRKLDAGFVAKYTTTQGYLELLPELPQPFIVGHADHLEVRVEQRFKDRILSAWIKYCFVTDLQRKCFDGPSDGRMSCARRRGFLSSWEHTDFSFTKKACQEHIADGCGHWRPGQPLALPSCLFSNTLQGLGFDAKSESDASPAPKPIAL